MHGVNYDQFNFNCISDEKWLPILQSLYPDINPYYYISTKGRIWSTQINDVMQTSITNRGYVSVSLSLMNRSIKRSRSIMIHRTEMILFNWIPGCENLEVNHKDGNKLNNDICNLEWLTTSKNLKHAYDYGLRGKGENHPMCSHTEKQVRQICEGLEQRLSLKQCAELAGLEPTHTNQAFVSGIKHGVTWIDISSQYNIHIGMNNQLFDDNEIHEICKLMEQGLDNESIVKIVRPELPYQKCKNVMYNIRSRKKFTRISNDYCF